MIKLSRADLHVHSRFSNKPSVWAMRKINCPESYTEPLHIYRSAKAKGMDFVTITDHNTIQGALEIAHLPGTFVSVELTSYFPENGCKIHVVALSINEDVFRDLMELRKNVYELVAFLRARGIVHFIAHPLYDMDDRMDTDTVEKMLLLFDVIEVRNGARAVRFNSLTREIVASLGPLQYEELREKHGNRPEFSTRWCKSMVGGSDDHSGFFVARAFTGVSPAATVTDFLAAIANGNSRADGEDGDPLTLAHTIYGIAYRFYTEKVKNRMNRSMPFANLLLNRCFHTDEKMTIGQKIEFFVRKNMPDLYRNEDESFEQLLDREARRLLTDKDMLATMTAEDRNKIFMITSYLGNRMIYRYTNRLLQTPLQNGIVPFLQSLGTLGVIHALASPYYVAYYHQHRSKSLLRSLRADFEISEETADRTALFTDTLHEINGVAMTIKRLVKTAKARNVELTVFTCGSAAGPLIDGVRTFPSIGDFSLPEYPELRLHFPPILDAIDAFERGGFTRVHVSTPGTMGLLGLAIAKLTGVPVAATYHTDIPKYVGSLTNDLFLENTAWNFIIWFYNQMDEVMVPSKSTRDQLVERGLAPEKIRPLPRWVDTETFAPGRRNSELWGSYGLNGKIRFLYVGRISKEKNLELLADSFTDVAKAGFDVGMVFVGDGPYREELEQKLKGYPALFTGFRHGEELAALYASSDVFVFPSTTDTFGNVVLEAQASGIPVIVSDEGGPKELTAPGKTGFVVKANDRAELARTMSNFVINPELCRSMGDQARRLIESKAPRPEEVYSTILKV